MRPPSRETSANLRESRVLLRLIDGGFAVTFAASLVVAAVLGESWYYDPPVMCGIAWMEMAESGIHPESLRNPVTLREALFFLGMAAGSGSLWLSMRWVLVDMSRLRRLLTALTATGLTLLCAMLILFGPVTAGWEWVPYALGAGCLVLGVAGLLFFREPAHPRFIHQA